MILYPTPIQHLFNISIYYATSDTLILIPVLLVVPLDHSIYHRYHEVGDHCCYREAPDSLQPRTFRLRMLEHLPFLLLHERDNQRVQFRVVLVNYLQGYFQELFGEEKENHDYLNVNLDEGFTNEGG